MKAILDEMLAALSRGEAGGIVQHSGVFGLCAARRGREDGCL